MFIMALAFVLGAVATQGVQVTNKPEPSVEQHISDVERELPAESQLRRELLNGARGNGIRKPWMDDMRKQGIKRAVIQVAIHFKRNGRPKQMIVKQVKFYTTYDDGTPISDIAKLNMVSSSGLEQTLKDIALQRATDGFWVDVPRPRPKPFDGGTVVKFFDDEWLPVLNGSMYCAGNSCFPSE
jgi:hypothetical protein